MPLATLSIVRRVKGSGLVNRWVSAAAFLQAANLQYVRGVLHDTAMERVPKTVNMKREIETVHKSL